MLPVTFSKTQQNKHADIQSSGAGVRVATPVAQGPGTGDRLQDAGQVVSGPDAGSEEVSSLQNFIKLSTCGWYVNLPEHRANVQSTEAVLH